MKKGLVRAGWIAVIALMSCASNGDQLAKEIGADAGCAARVVDRAVRLISFPTYGHALQDGTLLKFGGRWIVAGVDSRNPLMRAEDAVGAVPRVFREDVGEVSDFPWPAAGPLAMAPVPVPLEGGGWGVVWGSSRAPENYTSSEPWPVNMVTELWFSRWQGTWSPPQQLDTAAWFMDWSRSRTVKQTRHHGTLLMYVNYGLQRTTLMFGSPTAGVREVPLDSRLHLDRATFSIDRVGGITAAAAMRDPAVPDEPVTLHLLELKRGGAWVAAGKVQLGVPAVTALELHQDGGGTLHLVWQDREWRMGHAYRLAGDSVWHRTQYGNSWQGFGLLSFVAGVTRTGGFMIVHQAMGGAEGEASLIARCFRDGAWTEYERMPFTGINLTTGHTADGAWLLGWSGMHHNEPYTSTVLGFWAVQP